MSTDFLARVHLAQLEQRWRILETIFFFSLSNPRVNDTYEAFPKRASDRLASSLCVVSHPERRESNRRAPCQRGDQKKAEPLCEAPLQDATAVATAKDLRREQGGTG